VLPAQIEYAALIPPSICSSFHMPTHFAGHHQGAWKWALGNKRWTWTGAIEARGQPLEMPAGNRPDEKRMEREN